MTIEQIYPYCFESSIRLINEFIKYKPLIENIKNIQNMLLNYLQKLSDYLNNMEEVNNKLLS